MPWPKIQQVSPPKFVAALKFLSCWGNAFGPRVWPHRNFPLRLNFLSPAFLRSTKLSLRKRRGYENETCQCRMLRSPSLSRGRKILLSHFLHHHHARSAGGDAKNARVFFNSPRQARGPANFGAGGDAKNGSIFFNSSRQARGPTMNVAQIELRIINYGLRKSSPLFF